MSLTFRSGVRDCSGEEAMLGFIYYGIACKRPREGTQQTIDLEYFLFSSENGHLSCCPSPVQKTITPPFTTRTWINHVYRSVPGTVYIEFCSEMGEFLAQLHVTRIL